MLLALLATTTPAEPQAPYTQSALALPASPSFLLRDPQGREHRLADYIGNVVIVNFWATWCAPCRKELPSMNRAWAELKNESVVMLAINVSDDLEAIAAFLQDYPIDFPVLLDRDGEASQQWRVLGLPTTFVVNPSGQVVYREVGLREWDSDSSLQLVRGLKSDD